MSQQQQPPPSPSSSKSSILSSSTQNTDQSLIQNYFLIFHSSLNQPAQNSERYIEKLKYVPPIQITQIYPTLLFKKLIQPNLTSRDLYDLLRECYQIITLPVGVNRGIDFTNHSGIILFLIKLLINTKTTKKIKVLILLILTNIKLSEISQIHQINEQQNPYVKYIEYYTRMSSSETSLLDQLIPIQDKSMNSLLDVLYLNHKFEISDSTKIQIYECDGHTIHPLIIQGSSKTGNSNTIYTVLNRVKHHSSYTIQSNYCFSILKQELLQNFDSLSKQQLQTILKYNLRIMQQSEYLFQLNDCDSISYMASVLLESISQMDIICFRDSNFVNQIFPILKKIFLTISNSNHPLVTSSCALVLLECVKFFIHHSYTFIYDPNMLIERFFSIYWTHFKTNLLLHLELLNMLILNHSFIVENDLSYVYKYSYKTIFNIFAIIPYKVHHLVQVLLPCLVNEHSFTDIFHILTELSDPIYSSHVNTFLKIYFSKCINDEYMQVLIPIMIDKINGGESQQTIHTGPIETQQHTRNVYEDVIIEQLTQQVHKVYTNMTTAPLSNTVTHLSGTTSSSSAIINKMKTVLHSNNDKLFQSVCYAFGKIPRINRL
ncbi:hypothetical protein FDP41_008438 [Naegleria fowleri]|uniref:AP-5 complex subunit zeta-1 ARM repeats domain-containing protein n=1 Tax=Naegleria fowleri TaxID=5763 RepID=A0A6A5BFF4_NAEFO|nr:uncharacterized protein FDP41_008438 [Naegleria fowleri]KAF0973231.1 hypothetical protein FDP41_008438 [Naegleria fowleri]CAG4713034.1 unnamed protein product [Naegleria fowleri]